MAEVDFDEFDSVDYHAPRSARVQRIVHLAGAVSSVAMVIGLAVWGYNVAVRDVRGVPVIRAMEGPMRVTPDDPGGQIADNQGLLVNDIAATGTSGPIPSEIMLAPNAAELDLGDGPGLEGDAPPPEVMAAVAEASGVVGTVVMPERLPEPSGQPVREDREETGASTVEGDPVQELFVPPPAIDPTLIPQELVREPDIPPAPPGAVTHSPRPQIRPGALARATAVPVPASSTQEVSVTALKSGESLVQLGAFDSPEQARSEWTRLSGKFGSLLAGKKLVVQQTVSGGRTFFRLRAQGFEGEPDARRFCSALLAENAACIPVIVR
ncbi:SPOR domain-containing protein [Falsirhodobacter algicola]|uniref:SPOR domain-containing protein n=1 Tax=Falsirhodobacter algicola TaxID=2692330 RepID=A0A8J8SKQ7_9RHOB|nr:SPOR domain-containing protein [Falsirhodobacter algicola]QUS35608.1 SPOR domain-containing protein [Falsirhodobacter algicola]